MYDRYGSYVLPAGETFFSSDSVGLRFMLQDGSGNMVTIAGAVRMPGSDGYPATVDTAQGISLNYQQPTDGVFHIAAGGEVHVEVAKGQAEGVVSVWAPQVVNDGVVWVSSSALAEGFALGERLDNTTPDFINRGTITVLSGDAAVGVGLGNGGTIINSGTISASGPRQAIGLTAIYQAPGQGQPTSLDNSGVIRATSSAAHDGIAAWIVSTFGVGVTNSGLLEGDVALRVSGSAMGGGAWEVKNTGRMIGQVRLSDSADHFVNSGSVTGDVTLGAGGDVYDGRLGSATGMVGGGDGDDTLMGGAGFDYLQGNAGADSEAGGAGDDWVVGGQGNDQLSGGDGNDVVYANLGDDTLAGDAGNDWVRGGQGNDLLTGGAGDDWLSGDKGDDTISGGAGADIFHSFGDAGLDRVTDFNAGEGDRVQLDPGTTYSVAQVGSDTVISMTGGAVMTLVGVSMASLPTGWIFVG